MAEEMLTLPSRTDDDLGRPKVEEPVADLDRDLSGAEWNRVTYWIAKFGALFGKTDGTTVDSVFERIATLAFPPPVTQSTSTLTLDDSHNGKTIYITYAGECTITVPQTLTPGFSCSAQNVDAAATTKWAVSGTQALKAPSSLTKNTVRYATSGVIVRSATHAALVGALDS